MTFSFKTGSFTSRTTTGTDVVTGVGFQPTVILLFTTAGGTEATYASRFEFVLGAADDTTAANQQAIDASSRDDGGNASDGSNSFTEEGWHAAAAYTLGTNNAFTAVGAISAIGADGFTVNWTTNNAAAKLIYYICIAGSDITNTATGEFTSPALNVTGNQSTNVGFKPDLLMLYGVGETAQAVNYGLQWAVGFACSASQQATFGGCALDDVVTMDTARYQRVDQCFAMFSKTSTTTKALEGALVTMDANGFTINWTTVASAGASKKIGYVAIKGGSYKVGSFTAPVAGATPVSQATTGVGFLPSGIILASVGGLASSAIQTTDRVSFGAGSSSADRRVGWAGDTDGTANETTARIMLNNKIVKMATENATPASTTTQAEADLTSLDADGFTLSWTTRDTNAYEIIYVALGAVVAAGGGGGTGRNYKSYSAQGFLPYSAAAFNTF